jgi:hypothetical protein
MAVDHKARAEKFQKLAAELRQREKTFADAQIKQAQCVLRAAKGLHILREKVASR